MSAANRDSQCSTGGTLPEPVPVQACFPSLDMNENHEIEPSRKVGFSDNDKAENIESSKTIGSDPSDPFDPKNLRIDPSYLSEPVAKKLLTTVPVRKPHRQDFIRVHPAEDYRFPAALVELHDDRETYLVSRDFSPTLVKANISSRLSTFTRIDRTFSRSGR